MNKDISYKGIKAFVRDGTSDEFVVHEVMDGAYNKLKIKPDDVVVDFGLNIGMFTCWASKKGAKEVYAYEAEKENYELAKENIKLNDFNNVKLYNLAVIGNNEKTRNFSVNVKKNKGAHSLVHKKGRETVTVECININDVLEKVKPNVIKMDIEGGEYECLTNLTYDLSKVREFIMEFHHAHLNDIGKEVIFHEIIGILEKYFSNVEYRKEPKGAWVSTIYCSN
jgi:FkbM family methyltransferase